MRYLSINKKINGMNIKNSKLKKLLTKPITIGPNSTLVKVREALLKNKVKRLVVIDKKSQ